MTPVLFFLLLPFCAAQRGMYLFQVLAEKPPRPTEAKKAGGVELLDTNCSELSRLPECGGGKMISQQKQLKST